MIREVEVALLTNAVKKLFVAANYELPADTAACMKAFAQREQNPLAKSVLNDLTENLEAARALSVPICQDTGMAVLFIEIGQDVHVTGGSLEGALQQGVREAYEEGLLRKSVVADPLRRVNTGDNTPAIIHYSIVPGSQIKLTAAPKGFGSENMSGIRMLTPAAGRDGVMNAVLDIVKKAGGNPCPPMVIGVGLGGDFEQCALLAKKALCRAVSERNSDAYYAQMEAELLEKVNLLNIGPQGFGGDTTAFAVNIETAPTHIAGLPVAVNIGCHVTRHQSVIL